MTSSTLTSSTEGLPQTLSDAASDVADSLQRGASHAVDAVRNELDSTQDLPNRWADSCRASVREHPLSAVGLALLTGMLLSRIAR